MKLIAYMSSISIILICYFINIFKFSYYFNKYFKKIMSSTIMFFFLQFYNFFFSLNIKILKFLYLWVVNLCSCDVLMEVRIHMPSLDKRQRKHYRLLYYNPVLVVRLLKIIKEKINKLTEMGIFLFDFL